MDKDSSTRKRKKSIEDSVRNVKRSLKNGSGSEEEDEDLFSWEEYLKKCHAKAVPKETFKHVQDTKVQGFVPGMKLECMDRTSLETDTYWIATVVMSSGPLLLLRYDGYDDDRSGDFWCDAASEELQPIGWCTRTNNILIPPAAIRHKESNWAKFLMQDLKNAVCAPEHLFHRRSDPDEESQLKPGMKLELLHTDDPLSYWVASVVDSFGLRLRLRLEGSTNEADDAWVYFLSDNVHLLGFGKKHNLRLNVPSCLKTEYPSKDWEQIRGRLLGLCNLTTEDSSLNKALNKPDNLPKPHGFTIGMKLEAVNPKDPSSICAATVSKVANDIFFQVEIDSMISCGDGSRPSIWCSTNSRNVFPVGWCESNNIQLTPPPGYLVHPFRWQTYLEWTKSTAAPDSLFNLEIPSHEFDIGMKFEAVDQTDPSAMTVATVTQVVGRTMWVLLDGYKDDSIEHIYDVESFDLFPVGWCSMNGHPLLTPRIQRPPEENRRLASLRVTKQREIKKTASDSNVSNTANSSNTSLDTAKDLNTTDTVNTTASPETTTTVSESDAVTVTSALATTFSQSQSPVASKDLKKTMIKSEAIAVKEDKNEGLKTEGPKREGPKQEGLEKKVPITPKGKYELRASTLIPRDYGIKDEDDGEEIGEGETKSDKVEDVAVIDLTDVEDVVVPEQKPPPPKDSSEICIYVRKSCKCGPFLRHAKVAGIPSVIGPANPNTVLRQLVKQVVLSAHSSKVVLKLLASETDKMTISSIIRTLKTKLSLCENLISLSKVEQCVNCDPAKAPLSRKYSEQAPTVGKETIKPATLKTPVANDISQPSNLPAKSTVPVNSKPVTANTNTTPAGNPVKAATSANTNNKPAGVIPVSEDVPVANNSLPEPPRSESPSIAAARIAKHITKWTVSDVVEFIRTTDCHKFADDFMRQEIDGRALTLLSLDEIHKCLGVTLGPAIKLHFSVQNLLKKHR